MDNKSPAFQFYYKEWITGTMHMSRVEKDIYLTLLIYSYDLNGLPNDIKKIERYALIKTKTERDALNDVLQKFTLGEDNKYRNKVMEKVRKQQEDFKNRKALAAKKGAESRWKKPCDSNATAFPEQSAGNASTTTTTSTTTTAKESYMSPRVFLLKTNEVELEQIQMKSTLDKEEFELCIEQWSLGVEGEGFEYCGDTAKDFQMLIARLKKWINSWVKKNREKKKTSAKKENIGGDITSNDQYKNL